MNDLTKTQDNAPARRDWRETLDKAAPQFEASLPAHVPMDRFKRILASAIGTNLDLKRAVTENPQSVWASALAAAKDGLLPDGREAALVVFNTKVKCSDGVSRSLATAQYMPMIGGILKMMRQSGEVASLSAQVVYEADDFDYELGDEEKIYHKPSLSDDRGKMIACYAILKTKDGGIYRELMGRDQVMAVKKISRAKNGPWDGPFESEMWKKTVLRRLAKRAPLSTDIIDLIQRDDGMYDLDQPADTALPPPPPQGSGQVLDLTTGKVMDEDPEAPPPPEEEPENGPAEEADVLEGDAIPEEHGGEPEPKPKPKPKKKKAAAKKEPEPEPIEDAEVVEDEPPAEEPEVEDVSQEPDTEPEDEDQDADAFETKLKAKRAMRQAETIEDLEGIFVLAQSCSWYDGKGVPTTFELLFEELKGELEADG